MSSQPPPRWTTFGTGQPQLMSRMSAPLSSTSRAARAMRSASAPKIWTEARRPAERRPRATVEVLDRIRDVEQALGARDRHVAEPTLFLQLGLVERRKLRRKLALRGPDQEHGVPLQALGTVDRRQREPSFVGGFRERAIDCVCRRFEGEIAEHRFKAPIARGYRHQILQFPQP